MSNVLKNKFILIKSLHFKWEKKYIYIFFSIFSMFHKCLMSSGGGENNFFVLTQLVMQMSHSKPRPDSGLEHIFSTLLPSFIRCQFKFIKKRKQNLCEPK
jgi:hypothetical protein